MNVAVDTNVLVRAVVRDDARQARAAARLLAEAETIVVGTACLCEFAWVLGKVYRLPTDDIVAAIRALVATSKVRMDRPAVEAGLALLEAGGDFADGVIEQQGRWLGAESFVSFDRVAVARLNDAGLPATLLRSM